MQSAVSRAPCAACGDGAAYLAARRSISVVEDETAPPMVGQVNVLQRRSCEALTAARGGGET